MRKPCMRILEGSFTVEASIMVPFLLLVTIAGIFLTIFVYNRTLLIQDTEALISKIRMGGKAEMDAPQRHPYIFLEDINVTIVEKANEITVTISGEWKLPVLSSYGQTMSCSRRVIILNPVDVMFLTEQIMNIGENND